MATLFCPSRAITINSASEQTTAPAANLAITLPGMIWRSADLNGVMLMARVSGAWDTLALIGSNLRATDTIRVRAAADQADVLNAPAIDQTFAAWSGVSPQAGAVSLLTLPRSKNNPWVRVDITSTGNPDGFVEAQRLIIGKRVENPGLDIGFERTYEDTSAIESGPVDAITRYNVRIGWKLSISGMDQDSFEREWHPFARNVGQSRDFLFVEDTNPAYLQNRAAVCRFTGSAKGSASASDFWMVDAQIKSTS